MTLLVEPIASRHDRKSFTCGEFAVDEFLHNRGLGEAEGCVWVVVPEVGSSKVIAFYAIDPDPVTELIEDGNSVQVNFIWINWLGVGAEWQGQGIGRRLLLRVIEQIVASADQHGIQGLLLTALHQKAKDWYLHLNFGFREARSGSMRLLLPATTMRQLLVANQPSEW